MTINLQIEELKTKIVNIINESQLPVGVVKFIIKDLYNEINNIYEQTIEQEKLQQSKEVETTKDEE